MSCLPPTSCDAEGGLCFVWPPVVMLKMVCVVSPSKSL